MRTIFCICLILCGLTTFAQHVAKVSSKSDFKTAVENRIISEFTLDTELTAAELSEITDWINSNAQIVSLVVDGKNLKFSLDKTLNSRGAYEKFFMQCGISTIEISTGSETKRLTLTEFFDTYNL